MQFPRWVFPSNEARERILDAASRLGDIRLTVEFRHGSWFNEKNAERTLRFLTDNKIPYVVVDEPQGFKSSVPPVAAVTSPELAVFRFHGRRADTWEKPNIPPNERFRYLYDEDELADWAPRIAEAARSGQARARPDEQLLGQLRDHERPAAGGACSSSTRTKGSLPLRRQIGCQTSRVTSLSAQSPLPALRRAPGRAQQGRTEHRRRVEPAHDSRAVPPR